VARIFNRQVEEVKEGCCKQTWPLGQADCATLPAFQNQRVQLARSRRTLSRSTTWVTDAVMEVIIAVE
jgi:hypothetical protein